MKVITVHDTPPYGHAPTYQISLTYLERKTRYGPDKLRWEEEEAEEKNQTNTICLPSFIVCRSWHAEHFCSLNFPSISNSFWDIRWKY